MADVDSPLGVIDKPSQSIAARKPTRAVVTGTLLLLLAVTLFSRMGEFTNPLTHVDDQFYLFTGKAMLHGELPYVDVWDRKPIGLFLIYAAIAAIGGDSFLNYHLVAAAAALATGIVILRLAQRIAGWAGGVRAAVAYLLLLPTMGGAGGQSPVFYNLLIAGAALLTYDAYVDRRPLWPRALAAMALCGLAIQVKPTTLFEGAFFGLLLLGAAWRAGRSFPQIAALGASMVGVALAPTAAAFGAYALLGHAGEMWIATVVSIFTKAPLPWRDRMADVPQLLLYLGVPMLVAGSALALEVRRRGLDRLTIFLGGWLLAALLGYLSVPNFFNHYSLPLMVPLAVAMAPLFADRRDGMIFLVMVIALPVISLSNSPAGAFQSRAGFDRLAGEVKNRLHGGCLYVHLGPTALYTATNACHLSPYVFPDHLESAVEATALPVSPEAEVERIFAQRPTVVVTEPRHYLSRNNATAAIVERNLSCDYRLAREFPTIKGRKISLWALRDGPPRACPASHPPLGIVQPDPS